MSVNSRSSAALPFAPTMRFTGLPSLNRIIVGIDTTWKSRTGATILHGPHQVAQKSTSTGVLLDKTSSENESSVTFTVLLVFSVPVIVVLQSGPCPWFALCQLQFRRASARRR